MCRKICPALRRAIEKHVTEFASMHDEPLIEWDVLNEPYTDHEFMDLLGNEAVHDWFRLTKEANPRLTRYINDYGVLTRPSAAHQDFYFNYIKDLLAREVPVQGIGFQGHIPARFEPTPPEELLDGELTRVVLVARMVSEKDLEKWCMEW